MHSVDAYYARYARWYDLLMRPFALIRAHAIHQLQACSGARVLELGCGTGTSFPALVSLIKPAGQLFGVDRSRAMLWYARQKVRQAGWRQVALVQADANDLAWKDNSMDAILAFYTNDIFSSRQALTRALLTLRPNGRIVIAGAKLTEKPQGMLINRITRTYANRSIRQPLTTQPWQELEQQLGTLRVEEYFGGSAFLAYGTKSSTTVSDEEHKRSFRD